MRTRCARCGADAVVNRKVLIDASSSSSSGTSMMHGSVSTPGGQQAFNFSAYGTSSARSQTDLARQLSVQRHREISSTVRDVMLDAVERYIVALGAYGISAFNLAIPYDAPGARVIDGWPVLKGVYVLSVQVEGAWARAGVVRRPGGGANRWFVSMDGLGPVTPRPAAPAVELLLETNHQNFRASVRAVPQAVLRLPRALLSGSIKPGPFARSAVGWIAAMPKRLGGAAMRAKQVRPAVEQDVRSRIAAIDAARSICTRCGTHY
jgi:hypothetical protein